MAWIVAEYDFFSGGITPGNDLFLEYQHGLQQQHWKWNGISHYSGPARPGWRKWIEIEIKSRLCSERPTGKIKPLSGLIAGECSIWLAANCLAIAAARSGGCRITFFSNGDTNDSIAEPPDSKICSEA